MEDYPHFGVLMKNEIFRNRILFLNTRKDALKDKNMRIGLNYILDKQALLNKCSTRGRGYAGANSFFLLGV
jgi:ABC-type oligopeptide transport system substrate-binding subunit